MLSGCSKETGDKTKWLKGLKDKNLTGNDKLRWKWIGQTRGGTMKRGNWHWKPFQKSTWKPTIIKAS